MIFFFQAEDGIRDLTVTGVQTCALPIYVGSDSSIKVVKHDAGAQQTELELTYGKLRTQAQKIAKPDGKFEVRTPAGVAGVVGTDFFFEYANGTMNRKSTRLKSSHSQNSYAVFFF